MTNQEMVTLLLQSLKEEALEIANRFEINWDKLDSDDLDNTLVRASMLHAAARVPELEKELRMAYMDQQNHHPEMGKNQYLGYLMDTRHSLVDCYVAEAIYQRVKQISELSGTPLGEHWTYPGPE